MAERVERNSLNFKLAVFAIVMMFGFIPLRYVLPIFAPILPDDPQGLSAGLLVVTLTLEFLIFVLFLRAARLLLCTAKEMALLFVIDVLLIVGVSVVRIDRGGDQWLLSLPLIPITIAATYGIYCSVRKQVQD